MPRVSVGRFSIEVSSGWTLSTVILAGPVEEPAPEPGMLRGPTTRPFQRNLVATMEQVKQGDTLESYVSRQIEGLRKAGVERSSVGRPETVQLPSGVRGLLTEQVITGGSGEIVHQMQLVCFKEHVACRFRRCRPLIPR